MKNISTLFIKSFRNFNNFKMLFPEKQLSEGEKLNLNILIGRNGSGKSNLIDALFNIGIKNEPSDVSFKFYTLDSAGNNIISNYHSISDDFVNIKNLESDQQSYWKNIIRAHCSHVDRNKEISYSNNNECSFCPYAQQDDSKKASDNSKYFNDKYLDFDIEHGKCALISYILSGEYSKELLNKESLWHDLNKIVIEENPEEIKENNEDSKNKKDRKLIIKAIWIKANSYSTIFDETNKIPKYTFKRDCFETNDSNSETSYFYWTLEDIAIFYNDEFYKNNEDDNPAYTVLKEYLNEYICYDMGFLYRLEDDGDLYQSSSLSDGQRALLYRFAIVNLLKNEEEKSLLLLDEPETYFNEYWKSYFIYLLWETLKGKPHDVFIATHSAMLITDTKPEEIHRIVDTNDGAYHYKPQVNTYGVSVVDIGKYLFMMESDIGNRAKKEIQDFLDKEIPNSKEEIEKLQQDTNKLLKQVGPGEWRWKLRTKQKEIMNKLVKIKNNGHV